MTDRADIHARVKAIGGSPNLLQMLRQFARALPPGQQLDDDSWNLISWSLRPGNGKLKQLDFRKIRNPELVLMLKLIILHKRRTKRCSWSMACLLYQTIFVMDRALLPKPIRAITNEDFKCVEQYVARNYGHGTCARLCSEIARISLWLNSHMNLRVSYKPSVNPSPTHGRQGAEEGRQKRLIHIDVLRQLIGKNADQNLHRRDKFFINLMACLCATGFRVGELTTLPADCEEYSTGDYNIRYYAEKSAKLSLRVIPSAAVRSVKQALRYLRCNTERGREIAAKIKHEHVLDWKAIAKDRAALTYFIRKWCAYWLADPEHSLVRTDKVWINKSSKWIDVKAALASNGGNKSKLARSLGMSRSSVAKFLAHQNTLQKTLSHRTYRHGNKRLSWDTDSRVISVQKFCQTTKLTFRGEPLNVIKSILEDARNYQISGKQYKYPRHNEYIETRYVRRPKAVVYGENNTRLLEPEDALLITETYAFSDRRTTSDSNYTLVTDKSVCRWLAGEKRATDAHSQEASVFVRLEITDPSSGEIASFTPHDVRRWLDTIYENGGLTQDEIALIFGRTPRSNAVYDQTSTETRMERLRESIRKQEVYGVTVEQYSRLASFSREDAEQYLKARTLMAANMPHGICTLAWGMRPCPNQLSCLSNNDQHKNEPCEELIIDYGNNEQMREIINIKEEAQTMVAVVPHDSPQWRHFKGIIVVTENIINKCSNGSRATCGCDNGRKTTKK